MENSTDGKEKNDSAVNKSSGDDVSMDISSGSASGDNAAAAATATASVGAVETSEPVATAANALDAPMQSPASDKVEKASVASSDDETELEDELEPTPKRNKKTSNKKTAQDRANEDRKRRLSTLITMESYIHSILSIIKRDANTSSSAAAQNKEHTSEELAMEASTSAAAAIKTRPKGASTPPEPEVCSADMLQEKYNIELATELSLQSAALMVQGKSKANGQDHLDHSQDRFREPMSPHVATVVNSAAIPAAAAASSSSSLTDVASTSQAASPTQI